MAPERAQLLKARGQLSHVPRILSLVIHAFALFLLRLASPNWQISFHQWQFQFLLFFADRPNAKRFESLRASIRARSCEIFLLINLFSLGSRLYLLVLDQFHFEIWLQENQLIVLLLACLVGLIPESGPHLIFLTLYAEGTIPLSIFLASSVVQDGHGMLPMLAVSKRSFMRVKLINVAVGFSIGLLGLRFF